MNAPNLDVAVGAYDQHMHVYGRYTDAHRGALGKAILAATPDLDALLDDRKAALRERDVARYESAALRIRVEDLTAALRGVLYAADEDQSAAIMDALGVLASTETSEG